MPWRDIFPFELRPLQADFIEAMIAAFNSGKASMFNAPNGFGKTLCAIVSAASVERRKIYYATRTHRQAENVIANVKKINGERDEPVLTAMELSGKERTCIRSERDPFANPSFSCPCTTGGICKAGENKSSWLEVPSFAVAQDMPLPRASTSREISSIALQKSLCPYYLSTFVHDRFDLVACSYNHVLDPVVRDSLGIHLDGAILIFDEAHNILDAAESFLACELSTKDVKKFLQFPLKLSPFSIKAIRRIESLMSATDRYFKHESEPFALVKDVAEFLDSTGFSREWILKAIASLSDDCKESDAAGKVISFFSMLVYGGEKTIFCQHDKRDGNRSVKITSMDVKPLFDGLRQGNTKITFMSGTMPPAFFTRRAGISVAVSKEFTLPRRNLAVFPACRSLSSPKKLSSYYQSRDDVDVLNGFGDYLHDVLPFIPNGSIAFFTSYSFRDSVIKAWERKGYLDYDDDSTYRFFAGNHVKIPAFVEQSKDKDKTSIAKYKRAAIAGNALLLSVFRGGASEGEDFPGKQCKGVFCIGLPLRNVSSPEIKYKMNYYDSIKPGTGEYWLQWDAMTVVSQAIGRGIRDPFHDTSFAVLLDSRYCDSIYQRLMSAWIRECVDPDGSINTPIRVSERARSFFTA
jgi:Rad3-related DNA helicase